MTTDGPLSLTFLDRASAGVSSDLLQRCCGSTHWVRSMVDRRPFETTDGFDLHADEVEQTMTRDDWLESFAAHPRIGDRAVLRARIEAARGWEGGEQGGVDADDDALLDRLEQGNAAYEQRFGFIFLICATGLTGAELADALDSRLDADPTVEWQTAAAEQAKITRLRIRKLAEDHAPKTTELT